MKKDIRMEVTFRNNLIIAQMEHRGIKTNAELARRACIQPATLGRLINMTELPVLKNGNWSSDVVRLANFFGCLPEDLFSEFQRSNALETNRAEAELHFGEVHALLAAQQAEQLLPDAVAETLERNAVINQILDTDLTDREARILRAYYGLEGNDATLEQIGEELNISTERVRVIRNTALRKLRHPDRAHKIIDAAGIKLHFRQPSCS